MTYTLGVDLGTTTSAAAVLRDRHLEPCPLGESSLTVPSIVLPRDDGRTLIGEAAALHGGVAPVRLARAPGATGDPAGFPELGDPHQAMCMLLDAVVDQVASDRGGRPVRLALVQPAAQAQGPVGPYDRVAAETPGDPMLVAAPIATAAIVNHEWGLTAGSTIGVLDLGGDVSEAALVRRTGAGFDIVGRPCSGPGVGGSEIDEVVLRHIDSALDHALSTLGPDADMAALDRLLAGCRRAKEQLLHTEDAIVEVGLPRMTARVRLTRAELERLVRPHLAEAVAALERTIAETGLSADDLEAVVLIGGSARLPAVAELVAERIGRPVVVEAAPEMTAALGAALVGTPADERPDPLPATSLPLGAMVDATPAGGTVTFPATPATHAAWAADDGHMGERSEVDQGGQRRRRFIDRSVARWRPGDGQPAHRAPAPRHRGRWTASGRRPAGPEDQRRQDTEAQAPTPEPTGNGHHNEVDGRGIATRDGDHHDGSTAGLDATAQTPTPNTTNQHNDQATPPVTSRATAPDTGDHHNDDWTAGLGATAQDTAPNTGDRHDGWAAGLGHAGQNPPLDNQAAGLGATGQTPTPHTSDEHDDQATPAGANRTTAPDSGDHHDGWVAGLAATAQDATPNTGDRHEDQATPAVARRGAAPDTSDHHDDWAAGLRGTGQIPTPDSRNRHDDQTTPAATRRNATPNTSDHHDGWTAGLGATGQDATPNTGDEHDGWAAGLSATPQNATDPTPDSPRDIQAAVLGATGRDEAPDNGDHHDGWTAGLNNTGQIPTPDNGSRHDDQTTPAGANRDATPDSGDHDDGWAAGLRDTGQIPSLDNQAAVLGATGRDEAPDDSDQHDGWAAGLRDTGQIPMVGNGNGHDDQATPAGANRDATPDDGDQYDGWAAGLRDTGQISTVGNRDQHDDPADGLWGIGRHGGPGVSNWVRRAGRSGVLEGLGGAGQGSTLDGDGGRRGRMGRQIGRHGRFGGRMGGRRGERAGRGRDGRDGPDGGDHGSGDGTGEVRMHGEDRGNRRVVAASLTLLLMMAVGGTLLATGAAHRGSDDRPVDAVETSELPTGGETPGESDPARPTSIGSASSDDRPDRDDPSSSSTTAGRDRTAGNDRNGEGHATAGAGAGSTTTATDLDGDGRPDDDGSRNRDGHRNGNPGVSPDTPAPPTPSDPPITAPERPDAPPTTAPPPAPRPQPGPNLVEDLFGMLLGGQ